MQLFGLLFSPLFLYSFLFHYLFYMLCDLSKNLDLNFYVVLNRLLHMHLGEGGMGRGKLV